MFASCFVKGKTVLDIACGTGYGSDYLLKKGAKKVVGGDISKEAIEYAKIHYGRNSLFFIRLDVCALPFQSKCFDVVVSFETIEHLKTPEIFLSECRRVLKKGGLFICSTPNKQVTSPFSIEPVNPFHSHEFYAEEFCGLVKSEFSEVMLYGQNFINPVIHLTKLKCDRLIKFLEKTKSKLVKGPLSDKLLNEGRRYEVLPFQSSPFKTPTTIIAVAKNL
jgi:ubiquinone/menaquinone biosynthesis C-methylase UbiE